MSAPEIRPGQSVELLQQLHILTRDGKLNQDSRRKLKQIYHLFNFIEPLLKDVLQQHEAVTLVDHGAGKKNYLGFILYDLFFKAQSGGHIYGIETREELVQGSRELAQRLGFERMSFLHETVEQSINSTALPAQIDVVTALHACDTATDDAIRFALEKKRAPYRAGAVLPGRSGDVFFAQAEEPIVWQNRAVGNLAPPGAYARVW